MNYYCLCYRLRDDVLKYLCDQSHPLPAARFIVCCSEKRGASRNFKSPCGVSASFGEGRSARDARRGTFGQGCHGWWVVGLGDTELWRRDLQRRGHPSLRGNAGRRSTYREVMEEETLLGSRPSPIFGWRGSVTNEIVHRSHQRNS